MGRLIVSADAPGTLVHDARPKEARAEKPIRRVIVADTREEAESLRAAHSRLFEVGEIESDEVQLHVGVFVRLFFFSCYAPRLEYAVNSCTGCGGRLFADDTCQACGRSR